MICYSEFSWRYTAEAKHKAFIDYNTICLHFNWYRRNRTNFLSNFFRSLDVIETNQFIVELVSYSYYFYYKKRIFSFWMKRTINCSYTQIKYLFAVIQLRNIEGQTHY